MQAEVTLAGEVLSLCRQQACSHDTSAAVACHLQTPGTDLDRQAGKSTPPEQQILLIYLFKQQKAISTS